MGGGILNGKLMRNSQDKNYIMTRIYRELVDKYVYRVYDAGDDNNNNNNNNIDYSSSLFFSNEIDVFNTLGNNNFTLNLLRYDGVMINNSRPYNYFCRCGITSENTIYLPIVLDVNVYRPEFTLLSPELMIEMKKNKTYGFYRDLFFIPNEFDELYCSYSIHPNIEANMYYYPKYKIYDYHILSHGRPLIFNMVCLGKNRVYKNSNELINGIHEILKYANLYDGFTDAKRLFIFFNYDYIITKLLSGDCIYTKNYDDDNEIEKKKKKSVNEIDYQFWMFISDLKMAF